MIKSSDKNKLQKMELEQSQEVSSIRTIDTKNKSINSKVLEVNSKKDIVNKFKDLSQDWTECTKIVNLAQSNPVWLGEQLIEWTVDLGEIDIRLLPFLRIDIIYKLISSTIIMSDVVGLKNFFFEYKDIASTNEYSKAVTLYASLYFLGNDTLRKMNPVKAKLMIIWDEIPLIKKQLSAVDVNFNTYGATFRGWPEGTPTVWPSGEGGEPGEPAG